MLKRLGKVLGDFPMKSIFILIIMVVLLTVGVKDVFMATGNDMLVEPRSDVYQDHLMLEKEFGGEYIIVLYESQNLLTPDHLEHMKGIEEALQNNHSIYSIFSPVSLVEEMSKNQSDMFKDGISETIGGLNEMSIQAPDNSEEVNGKAKSNQEILVDSLADMDEKLQSISENLNTIYDYSDIMTPGLPESQATLDSMIYDDDDNLRPMFEEVVIDGQYMTMMIKLKGDTDDAEKSEVIDTINNYLDTNEMRTAETMVSGKPVLDHATRSSMQESIQNMMGLALIIMIIVLFIVFKVRWRLLPLVTVLIAVIGTVGLMGWLQIPITMVSMAVFPILIGLGIDYAIQFQNRYAEEMAKEDSNESRSQESES